jgi:predicted O-methyltransferase YrrM
MRLSFDEIIAHTNHIPSSVYPTEQLLWYNRLEKLPPGSIIVDFGTGWGKSAASLGLSAPDSKVYTFDIGDVYLTQRNVETYEEYEATVNKYLADTGATNVIFKRGSSLEVRWDTPIDILNIDSDHTYETTKAEMLRWIPYVKEGGLVFFHDYEHPRCPGIRQAIDELIPAHFSNLKLVEVTPTGTVTIGTFQVMTNVHTAVYKVE